MIFKGILVPFLVLTPVTFLIVKENAKSLLPISGMTLLLGGLLGYSLSLLSETK